MVVEPIRVIAVDADRRIVFRVVLDRLLGEIEIDPAFAPINPKHPVRRYEDPLAGQPVSGVGDEIPDRPAVLVDLKILDMADPAVPGADVIAAHLLRAA